MIGALPILLTAAVPDAQAGSFYEMGAQTDALQMT
jgi:hypothetical protein